MTTAMLNSTLPALEARRRALGMSTQALAARSKVSRATVCRILSGQHDSASFKNVAAVAGVLGMKALFEAGVLGTKTIFEPQVGHEEYLERQAEKKARFGVSMVQGTMGLEAQGISAAEKEVLVKETQEQLLSGSRLKLWR